MAGESTFGPRLFRLLASRHISFRRHGTACEDFIPDGEDRVELFAILSDTVSPLTPLK